MASEVPFPRESSNEGFHWLFSRVKGPSYESEGVVSISGALMRLYPCNVCEMATLLPFSSVVNLRAILSMGERASWVVRESRRYRDLCVQTSGQ